MILYIVSCDVNHYQFQFKFPLRWNRCLYLFLYRRQIDLSGYRYITESSDFVISQDWRDDSHLCDIEERKKKRKRKKKKERRKRKILRTRNLALFVPSSITATRGPYLFIDSLFIWTNLTYSPADEHNRHARHRAKSWTAHAAAIPAVEINRHSAMHLEFSVASMRITIGI